MDFSTVDRGRPEFAWQEKNKEANFRPRNFNETNNNWKHSFSRHLFPHFTFSIPFLSLSLALCLSFFMSLANQRQVERERERGEGRKSKGVFLRWRILEFLAGRAVGGRGKKGFWQHTRHTGADKT